MGPVGQGSNRELGECRVAAGLCQSESLAEGSKESFGICCVDSVRAPEARSRKKCVLVALTHHLPPVVVRAPVLPGLANRHDVAICRRIQEWQEVKLSKMSSLMLLLPEDSSSDVHPSATLKKAAHSMAGWPLQVGPESVFGLTILQTGLTILQTGLTSPGQSTTMEASPAGVCAETGHQPKPGDLDLGGADDTPDIEPPVQSVYSAVSLHTDNQVLPDHGTTYKYYGDLLKLHADEW